MRPAARLTLSALLLAMLAACGVPAPPDQDKEDARAQGRDTDETVFDDMIQTQDKARAVEDLSMQHKADIDAAIEASEGEAPPDER
jgi:hypothetical protein